MAKISALALAAAAVLALVALSSTPAFVATPARPRTAQVARPATATPEAAGEAPAVQPAAVAALVGLLVGLASSPLAASAGVARSLPDFALSRPEYMQGIDASNSATKPGEVDYVTRSQIQWVQMPKAREEALDHNSRVREGPAKAERVEKVMSQLRELASEADIPA
uniref:PS II complex 12 kDa extrinsic protein n=1 Tax=Alexandrium andersonii TaxID=327968 RepID=A0A7S2FFT0_9DINO